MRSKNGVWTSVLTLALSGMEKGGVVEPDHLSLSISFRFLMDGLLGFVDFYVCLIPTLPTFYPLFLRCR